MTRVSFAGGHRVESQWTLEYRVPVMQGAPDSGRRETSSFILRGASKALTFVPRSAYVISSVAVYLARCGDRAITVVFPEPPRLGPQGGTAPARAVVLFDDDPVSTPCSGTWYAQAVPARSR